MPLLVAESFINQTKGYRFGDSEPYEAFTEDVGVLYRDCLREYGRCKGKVYVDTPDGAKAIGWVFEGKQEYEDTHEPYIRETWVTLHDAPPKKSVEYSYHYLKGRP